MTDWIGANQREPRSARQRSILAVNNSRGADMLAALKPGTLVTVRRDDGGQSTGRAEFQHLTGQWYARPGPHLTVRINEFNIVAVRPGPDAI
jgi:hypothetical protein